MELKSLLEKLIIVVNDVYIGLVMMMKSISYMILQMKLHQN